MAEGKGGERNKAVGEENKVIEYEKFIAGQSQQFPDCVCLLYQDLNKIPTKLENSF